MSENQGNRGWWERMNDRFRLVILRDADLSELRSFRLSGRSIYIFLSSFVLLLAIGITSLLVFTPLKQWIPGYGDVTENYQFTELKREVKGLVETIEEQETYINGMRQMLGDGSVPAGMTPPSLDLQAQGNSNQAGSTGDLSPNNMAGHFVFTPPIRGEISDGFMSVKDHFGIDIIAPKDAAIAAIAKGTVVSAGWNLDTGYSISLQHEHNVISVYRHNSNLLKKTGDQVKEGESIAIIGNTGHLSSGPHLHFELWFSGVPVDPAKYISFE